MGKMDELIKQFCPNGVEVVELGKIAKLVRGKVISKKYVLDNNGEYPVYSSQTSNNGEFGRINTYMFDGDYVTWTTDGAYAGTVFRRTGKFNITNICGLIKLEVSSISVGFLYYWLAITAKKYVNRATDNPKLMSNVVATIKVPLPPLAVQKEIVGILDTFAGMIDNLQKELKQRQKQFEHYRDQLLTFKEDECKYSKLADVCEVINGRAYKQSELLSDGKYRVLRVGNFFSNDSWYYSNLELDDKNYCQKGDLLYAWSASFGPRIWKEEKVVFHYHIWKMACSDGLDRVFFYYWLQSHDMERQVSSGKHGATMAHLTKKLMESLMIPVPSLEKQQEIVDKLDTFEALISNIKQEIELRQKQYEYYREKLLTFE